MGLTKKLYDYQEIAKNAIVEHWTTTLEDLGSSIDTRAKRAENDRMRLLSAPTGSGKTFVVSSVLMEASELFDKQNIKVAYVVLTPNSLNKQFHAASVDNGITSQGKLQDVSIDEVKKGRVLKENDVLFTNYSSVDKVKNTVIVENERGTDLKTQFDNLRAQGIHVVLIVDEAHVSYSGAKAQAFIDDIVKPSATLLVTATPHEKISGYDFKQKGEFTKQTINVSRKDVVDSGAIVKKVIINKHIGELIVNNVDDDSTVDMKFIDMAITMSMKMNEAYRQEGSDVNTLVGIQIPSKSKNVMEVSETYGELQKDSALEKDKRDAIIKHLGVKWGMFVDDKEDGDENGQIAYWFADHKTKNAEDDVIKPNNSHVNVIIFKEAIAVGWDCPRLGALALLRENKTKPFTLQTVGRAMRQPEQKHYDNEILNHAYVFSAHELVKRLITESPQTTQQGDSKEVALDFNDPSVVSIYNTLNYHDGLQTDFYRINNNAYVSEANIARAGSSILESLDVNPAQIGGGISVSEWQDVLKVDCFADNATLKVFAEQSLDVDANKPELEYSKSQIALAEKDIESQYEKVLLSVCHDGHVAPNSVTAMHLRGYLYDNVLPRSDADNSLFDEIQFAMAVTANDQNRVNFKDFIQKVMEKAFELQGKSGKSRVIEVKDTHWTPPSSIRIPEHYADCKKCGINKDSRPEVDYSMYECIDNNADMPTTEKRFIEHGVREIAHYLEKDYNDFVEFRYMKNGEQGHHFGMRYQHPNGTEKLTFPDFFLFFKREGVLHIYIIETKSKGSQKGDDNDTVLAKAQALKTYADSATTENIKVYGDVWAFGNNDSSDERLNIDVIGEDSTQYITGVVKNMIDTKMNGFK